MFNTKKRITLVPDLPRANQSIHLNLFDKHYKLNPNSTEWRHEGEVENVDTSSGEVERLTKENRQLKIKVELLLDMLAIKSLDIEKYKAIIREMQKKPEEPSQS